MKHWKPNIYITANLMIVRFFCEFKNFFNMMSNLHCLLKLIIVEGQILESYKRRYRIMI